MSISPLSIPPSQVWRGNDGQWSTFMIEVGTPGQAVELLPGTSSIAGNSVWVVIPLGCTVVNPSLAGCDSMRGYLFLSNQSTSWSTSRIGNGGLYNLGIDQAEGMLGLSGNAYYGFDTVRLGGKFNPGLPSLRHQVVAGIATNDFWIGSLGLSPTAFNFTNLNDPVPSLLGSLRRSNLVPSTSWAYTAGMPYREPPIYGSLTLGGYDSSRRSNRSSISIPFGADASRDLLVGLQSITYDTLGSSPLLSSGIYAFIDSMVSQMWLPVDVCQAFEKAFDLTWNATTELYTLTESQHESLLAQNPTFTFTIGSSADGGEIAKIVLPYAAFDLSVTQPAVDSETKYFPLKRAGNSSQFTLGRVFLQEAYVVADYDRRNFSVSQAVVPSRDTTSNIVAIEFSGEAMSGHGTDDGGQLSTGTLAGIVVGGVAALVLIIAAFLLIRRLFSRSDLEQHPEYSPYKKSSIRRHSGRSSGLKNLAEMNAIDSGIYESDSRPTYPPELDGDGDSPKYPPQVYELRDRRSVVAELEAPFDRFRQSGGKPF